MDGLRIYRGINQIGGIVTEIRKGSHRVLIDMGANLPGTENAESSDDELISEVFAQKDVHTDAVLFTHYHGDHVGLKNRIDPRIPMYVGRTAKEIMKIVASGVDYVKKLNGQEELIELPVIERMLPYWTPGVFKDFNGIRIMPLICDHSALDAYMFVIEINDWKILYTGDFRAHGIPGEDTFEKLIKEKAGRVDVLVTEGTMVSRMTEASENAVRTEAEMKERAGAIFGSHKDNVVLVSSTNTDSVMSFYHATPEDKAFLCDPYQARIIKTAIEARHRYFPKDYSYAKNIYVLCPDCDPAYMRDLEAYTVADTGRRPFKMAYPRRYKSKGTVMLARPDRRPNARQGKFKRYMQDLDDPFIVYSMWTGYLKGGKAQDPAVVKFMEGHMSEDRMEVLHTSGHAYVEDLRKLMDMTDPGLIVPMHTESVKAFKELELFSPYRDRIVELKPGDILGV